MGMDKDWTLIEKGEEKLRKVEKMMGKRRVTRPVANKSPATTLTDEQQLREEL